MVHPDFLKLRDAVLVVRLYFEIFQTFKFAIFIQTKSLLRQIYLILNC